VESPFCNAWSRSQRRREQSGLGRCRRSRWRWRKGHSRQRHWWECQWRRSLQYRHIGAQKQHYIRQYRSWRRRHWWRRHWCKGWKWKRSGAGGDSNGGTQVSVVTGVIGGAGLGVSINEAGAGGSGGAGGKGSLSGDAVEDPARAARHMAAASTIPGSLVLANTNVSGNAAIGGTGKGGAATGGSGGSGGSAVWVEM